MVTNNAEIKEKVELDLDKNGAPIEIIALALDINKKHNMNIDTDKLEDDLLEDDYIHMVRKFNEYFHDKCKVISSGGEYNEVLENIKINNF